MSADANVLVLDLDGTLLNSDGVVSDANRSAVHRAHDAGWEIIIATGRSWTEARAVLVSIGLARFMIAAGGSLLCDRESGSTIDRRSVCRTVVSDVADVLIDDGHRILILKDRHATGYDYLTIGDAPLDPASAWWFETHQVEVRHVDHLDDDAHPEHSLRVGAVASGSAFGSIATTLRDVLRDRAVLQHWGAVTESEATGSPTHLLEVFDTDVNKWTMVERFCARFGYDPGRVAAVGDGLNDRELIAGAARSFAMDNADQVVRSTAQHVVAHHDCDGVAEAIELLLTTA
ncbi:MAG: HAD-IIB family hydrolase [Planctomycetota bacterium]